MTILNKTFSKGLLTPILFMALLSAPLRAQSSIEEKWQDLFVTAGYATAFGAALGAASLSFMDHQQNPPLRVIAMGASVGFIAGSLLGGYLVVFESASHGQSSLSTNIAKGPSWQLQPHLDFDQGSYGALLSFRL